MKGGVFLVSFSGGELFVIFFFSSTLSFHTYHFFYDFLFAKPFQRSYCTQILIETQKNAHTIFVEVVDRKKGRTSRKILKRSNYAEH